MSTLLLAGAVVLGALIAGLMICFILFERNRQIQLLLSGDDKPTRDTLPPRNQGKPLFSNYGEFCDD